MQQMTFRLSLKNHFLTNYYTVYYICDIFIDMGQ